MVRWVFLALLLGISWWRVVNYTQDTPKFRTGTKVRIRTTILDTPKVWGWKKTIEFSGIEVNLPIDADINIGDEVEVVGSVQQNLTEDKKISISLNTDFYSKLGDEHSLRVLMAKARTIVISRLLRWLPGDSGGLAAGILVGGDDDMSAKGVLAFRKAGISHIIAASGYNVTVVSGWAAMILERWLNKFLVIYIGIVSIILYVYLAGGSAAVIRAGVMVCLVLGGKILGREADGKWIWLLTGLFMVAWNPGWFTDVGFQLSMAAMGGIIFLARKSLWSQTMACQITTLPLILHYFGNLSVLAPLANMLFLWPVPIVMPVLALASVVGVVFPVGGEYLSLLTWPLLNFMLKGANLLSSAHWTFMTVEKMNWTWVGVYYFVLIIINRYFIKRSSDELRN